MAKDYAKSTRKSKPATKKGGAMKPFLWGMVFGIVLSAAGAWYFRDHWLAAQDLYQRATAANTSDAQAADPDAEQRQVPEKTKSKNELSAADKKYKPLADDSQTAPAWQINDLLAGDAKAKSTEEKLTYMLACAAFSVREKAESMKAEIALRGLKANVKSVDSKGSTLYRVQLGPYSERTKAEIDRDNLFKLGIKSCQIR